MSIVVIVIIESPCSSTEKSDFDSASYEVKPCKVYHTQLFARCYITSLKMKELVVMMHKIVHDQVQVESRAHLIPIASHAHKGPRSTFPTALLQNLLTFFIPPQLNYGMNYPAVLLNRPP